MTYKSYEVLKNPEIDTTQLLSLVFALVLMLIGLWASVSLLEWTIAKKFNSINDIEQSDITAQSREKQLACLAKNIYYEAGSEPFEGKVAVAQVTLNRAASGKFPNDICQVVYQKNGFYEKTVCQFSWYCDRESTVKPLNKAVFEECMTVAKKVLLENFRLPGLQHALYFHGTHINPGWNREKLLVIGRHVFYR
jgi:spore germination cell wall hydrolase CwlJ-like protein